MQGALDQIVQRFGTDMVAEVTGRSRRIVRKGERLCVENRAGSANLADAQAFMDDDRRRRWSFRLSVLRTRTSSSRKIRKDRD